MRIETKKEGECLVLTVDGNVLQENVPEFQKELRDAISGGHVRIVLDLGGANYISSMCLATIVEARNRLDAPAHGSTGDIRIARANTFIVDLLKVTNLIKKIRTFDTVAEAVGSFS